MGPSGKEITSNVIILPNSRSVTESLYNSNGIQCHYEDLPWWFTVIHTIDLNYNMDDMYSMCDAILYKLDWTSIETKQTQWHLMTVFVQGSLRQTRKENHMCHSHSHRDIWRLNWARATKCWLTAGRKAFVKLVFLYLTWSMNIWTSN